MFFLIEVTDRMRVVSKHPWADFELTLFEGTFKTVASRHKCGDTLLKKHRFVSPKLGDFFKKKREIPTQYSVFRTLCCLLLILCPKTIINAHRLN